MKKILRLFTVLVALLACAPINATDITLKEGDNKVSVNDFTVNATYTAKKTGKVVIDASVAFDKVECNGTTYSYSYAPGASHGAYHYEVNAEAGQVITMVSSFFLSNGSSIWVTENGAGPVPITVQQISPTNNKTFSWAVAGMMTINFNKAVVYDNIWMVASGKKYPVDEATAGSSVGCNLKNAIETAMEEGTLKEGDRFVVRMEGLRDMADATNRYNGNGVIEVAYLAPALQGKMVSAKVDGQDIQAGMQNSYTMLSYYDADGEEGLVRFEFSSNIKSIGRPRLRMGALDRSAEGLYYEGEVPYTIDGKTLTIDLRGELRSYARLFPGVDLEAMDVMGTEEFTTIALSIVNVIDESGNPMATDIPGNVGSFTYTFNFKEIVDNIVMDGDRAEDMEGSVKGEGDVVQLWIDQELKAIESVKVYFKVIDEGQGVDEEGVPVYVDGMTEVALSSIETISSDPYDGTVLGFTIPKMEAQIEMGGARIPAEGGQPLRIVLSVKTMNGMPHDLVINYVCRSLENGLCLQPAADSKAAAAYNLSGQRINAAQAKGIVVIDGKKILK